MLLLPIAQIVDVGALASVVLASLAGGVGLTTGFSVALFSATRASEMRRQGTYAGATLLTLVAIVAGGACVALVALGLYLIAA